MSYTYISNIKSNQQVSAEQIASSPESGVKSRINELYDTLKARNLGSDTDLTTIDTLTDDWGSKWNRIKTAALSSGSGSAGGVKSVQRGVSQAGTINLSQAVDPNKSVVSLHGICSEYNNGLHGNARHGSNVPYVSSLTSSTLSVSCADVTDGSRRYFSWEVIEYY